MIHVVIEAMITFIAVQDNTRIGLFGQSLFSGIGGSSQCSERKTGLEAGPLSTEPSQDVRDNVIRVLYTWKSDSKRSDSRSVLLKGVKKSHPGLILGTGKLHQYHGILSGRAGV